MLNKLIMDQRLILALENLGNALEEIASSLQSKEKPKTSGVEAMKSGDFGKQLESISKQLTSIKADTQAILKEQKTIQSMSKQKETKKETPMEEIGKDKKKESALKKGLGTILLIAVAVLAIGMAFKLVGKIDFLSVIALGLAIYVVAEAFAKIAALNLSLREAFVTSLVMVGENYPSRSNTTYDSSCHSRRLCYYWYEFRENSNRFRNIRPNFG